MAGRSKRAPPVPPTVLDDIPDAVLLHVFAALPPAQRRSLPLVCRRWRAICEGPSELWEDLFLNFSGGRIEDSSAMYRWLLQRRSAVKKLTMVVETEDDCMSAHLVLGLLAGGLQHLAVRAGREGQGMHSMAWLSVLRQLRSLRLDYEQEDAVQMCAVFPPGLEELVLHPVTAVPLQALPAALSRLSALRVLSVRAFTAPGANDDEAEEEPGALSPLRRLTALQDLRLDHARLPSLRPGLPPSLTSLSMRCASFNADCAPLRKLTALARLDLRVCALAELPPQVAALPALRTLLLAGNYLRALPDGRYLASLERLDVRDNELAEVPPVLAAGCSRLEQLDLSSYMLEGGRFAARDLRALLAANPRLRQLSIPAGCGTSAAQLANLRSSFPRAQVFVVEMDARGEVRGRGPPHSDSDDADSGGSDWVLGSAEEEESEEEYGPGPGWWSGADSDAEPADSEEWEREGSYATPSSSEYEDAAEGGQSD